MGKRETKGKGKSRPKSSPAVACDACPLNGVGTKIPGEGPSLSPLVLVGEAGGAQEIRARRPFVGPSGKQLDMAIKQAGIDRTSIYLTNAVLCMELPPRTPSAKEIKCCQKRLIEEVRARSPKVVLAMGKSATKALLDINRPIGEERGSIHYAPSLDAYVIPTYHPAHILRNPHDFRDLLADIIKAREFTEFSSEEAHAVITSGIKIDYTVVNDVHSILDFMNATDNLPEVALDTETASDGSLLCLGLSVEEGKAVVIPKNPLLHTELEYPGSLETWFSKKKLIGHNLKHDLRVLRNSGVLRPRRIPNKRVVVGGDTMLQSYVLNPLVGGHGLKQLVRDDLNYYEDYAAEAGQYIRAMENCPSEETHKYNAYDAGLTLILYHKLLKRLDANDKRVLNTLLYPAADALLDMECLGIAVDRSYLLELQHHLTAELEHLEKEMYGLAGREFNPRSPKQLFDVMYTELGLPVPARLSTDKGALEILSRVCDHPFIPLLQKYRERHKFYSTYVRKLYDISSADGRAHTTFNLHTTVTGRLSSSKPVNLQNIPKTEEARNIFVASPEYTLIEADLKNAEIRGWAWYSRDEALKKAFMESGVDIHTATACLMWNLKPEKVTPEQRNAGKRLSFGTLYGMDATTLAKELGVPVPQAKELQDRFFRAYQRGQEWIREQQQRIREEGVFRTPFGRRLLFAPNAGDPSEIDRISVNYPVQSLCSDIALFGLIRHHDKIIRGALGDSRLLLTVHDAVLLETKEPVVDIAHAVKEIMEVNVLDGWMLFEAEVKAGQRWGAMEEIC